jgi:prephenate dehydrogenase
MWERAGMRVVTMNADHHDKVLAVTSHLPHLIAYTIVGTAADLEGQPQIRGHRVLGQRLSRLHPDRRLRSGDVARRLSQQP